MKQIIRNKTFETNSSSMHSLILVEESVFTEFKNGKTYFVIYGDKFVTKEELVELDSFKSEYPEYVNVSEERKEEMLDEYIDQYCDGDYPEIATYNSLDLCTREVYDKDGNKQIAFSYYIAG